MYLMSNICKDHKAHFPAQPPPKKTKKSPPEKNSLYFRKWNFLALILKKILIFSRKITFFVFSEKKAFLIFPETEPCTFQPKLEK